MTCAFQVANGVKQFKGDLKAKRFKASGSFCPAVVLCLHGSACTTGMSQYDHEGSNVVRSNIAPVKLP